MGSFEAFGAGKDADRIHLGDSEPCTSLWKVQSIKRKAGVGSVDAERSPEIARIKGDT